MKQLQLHIKLLQNNIFNAQKCKATVSVANVSWHIDHSLKVIFNIIDSLQKSDPKNYKWKFNTGRTLVLLLNKIPRGKGKAPAPVNPLEKASEDVLKKNCEDALQKINELDRLPANSYFLHPYFGNMNLNAAKKLLVIHTKHHIKIIEDIIK